VANAEGLTAGRVMGGGQSGFVDRKLIPSIPKSKVLFPISTLDGDQALTLLKTQNPDVPTADWKVLNTGTPSPKEGGRNTRRQRISYNLESGRWRGALAASTFASKNTTRRTKMHSPLKLERWRKT